MEKKLIFSIINFIKFNDRQMGLDELEIMNHEFEQIDLTQEDGIDLANEVEMDAEMDIALNQYDYDQQ